MQDYLKKHAIAYLSCNAAVSGHTLVAQGSTALFPLLRSAAEKVEDPETGMKLLEVWSGNMTLLPSIADYTVFANSLGISSLNFFFSGNYGVSNSLYDSFYWMDTFGDSLFQVLLQF